MNRHSIYRWSAWLIALVLAAVAFFPALPAQADSGPLDFGVKFAGVITEIPAASDTLIGTWKIAGKDVVVTAATRLLPGTSEVAAGMWADVMAIRQADGALLALKIIVMPPEIRITGPIQGKPDAEDSIGDWNIAGLTVEVTADTRISPRGGPLEVNDWVEVHALRIAGKLVAVRLRGIETQPDVKIFGAIEAIGDTRWTLSGIELALTEDTLILGAPAVGLLAHAAASLRDDNSLLALRLRVAINQPGGWRTPLEFDGIVEKLPDRGLVGEWTVSGRQVIVSANTAIHQEQGLVVVGARVHVVGWQIGDRIMALQVVVLSSPAPGGRWVRFRGPVQELPEGGLVGLWKVDGRTVKVTEATRIIDARHVRVGALVEVGGILGADAVVTAAWIWAWPWPGPGPR